MIPPYFYIVVAISVVITGLIIVKIILVIEKIYLNKHVRRVEAPLVTETQ